MGIVGIPKGLENEWQVGELAAAGLQASLPARLDRALEGGELKGLHSLLIIRNGKLVLERYFEGEDEIWGRPLGPVSHGPDLLHDMRSVTKSIVGLLYGIALAHDRVPPVTARLIDQFPEYPDLADPQRRRITIAHVLSMRLGLEWHEDNTYSDPRNGEREMEAAADRYRFILQRPVAERPGLSFTYCGGATALLGRIIARGVGKRLEDYAREKIFGPLGISRFEWIMGSDGEASASSGLRLRPRDLARAGLMILDHGLWMGRAVVPRNWLSLSFKPRAYVEKGLRYGYQWWLGELISNGKPWVAAFGNGGQRLIVIPSLRMVVVMTAGNYNTADQWKMPVKVMGRLVIPAVVGR